MSIRVMPIDTNDFNQGIVVAGKMYRPKLWLLLPPHCTVERALEVLDCPHEELWLAAQRGEHFVVECEKCGATFAGSE